MGKQSRGTLPKEAVEHLKNWLFLHFQHPYPSEEEKSQLAEETSLSLVQVNNWFINARRRLWKPIIDKQTQKDGNKTNTSNSKEGIAKDETLEDRSARHSLKTTPDSQLVKNNGQQIRDSPRQDILNKQDMSNSSTFLSSVDQSKSSSFASKPLKMSNVLYLYTTDTKSLREKIENAQKDIAQVLNQSKLLSPEYRKKRLFERWNYRDYNSLSIESMKASHNVGKMSYSLPIGINYIGTILSDPDWLCSKTTESQKN